MKLILLTLFLSQIVPSPTSQTPKCVLPNGLTLTLVACPVPPPPSTVWGTISGTLSNQVDLQLALNAQTGNPFTPVLISSLASGQMYIPMKDGINGIPVTCVGCVPPTNASLKIGSHFALANGGVGAGVTMVKQLPWQKLESAAPAVCGIGTDYCEDLDK